MNKISCLTTSLAIILLLLLCSTEALQAQERYVLTVAQDGSGDFTKIQPAIDACKSFPDERVTVYIKNGVYNEKVRVPACNTKLSLVGESTEKTIITFNDCFGTINRGRNSTFFTYTMLVEADDFYAENLTIENSAGPVGQAVALHVEGDRCAFRNCRIAGNQDTLYAAGEKSRLYFNRCFIEGTTDFIFGGATALFDECVIHSKSDSYITAASTPKGKRYGLVFLSCKLTATEGTANVFLGRPWRDYAKTVFINCHMGAHITPEGWANWENTSRDKTAYYAEFDNIGPGATKERRVTWSHQLRKKEAARYTVEKILGSVTVDEPPVKQWTSVGVLTIDD